MLNGKYYYSISRSGGTFFSPELKNHGYRRLRMLEMSAWLDEKPLNAREH